MRIGRLPNSESDWARARKLATRISRERTRQGLTQDELAAAARHSVDMVRALERPRSANPGVFVIADIASALGVTVEQLTK